MFTYHHADEIIKPHNNSASAIWIGDLNSAENFQWLRENRIKTIITAADGFNIKYPPEFRNLTYKLQDKKSENIGRVLEDAADRIEKFLSHGSVLVHCGAGVSRSSTIVIGYLLKYKKMTFLEALKFTKSKRPGICPNLGFELQLKSFQKLLKSRNLVRQLNQRAFQLPEIDKSNITLKNNPSLVPASKKFTLSRVTKLRRENSLVSNGDRRPKKAQQNKGKNDLEALKKMAMFRFGITNTQNWRLG